MENDLLDEVSRRNIVAKGWVEHYRTLMDLLSKVKDSGSFSGNDVNVFEDEIFHLYRTFEAVAQNPGLRDWFKEFAELQTGYFAGLEHYHTKYEDGPGMAGLFSETLEELKKNERELIQRD
ncbi:hypothetical protein [Catenisphaera adipataccumulans]|jgi:hypothetical protein|uniref:Uncharacterized protein n=1 Tax=Catenisphaera adipataccumulans TaxID=700500 RepID=A0A7W8CYM2_9FIRM|nr:hypothetical protein [Catenisphaera adipataccumulans]MBB5183966.1 hypothetical protein [Catenisphaera adipataccumulans]